MDYISECYALELNHMALVEAGGIVSWFKRTYTNHDKNLPLELEKELRLKVKSEKDKEALIKEIDGYIDEVGASRSELLGARSSPLAHHLVAKAEERGDIANYVAALKTVRSKAAAFKVA